MSSLVGYIALIIIGIAVFFLSYSFIDKKEYVDINDEFKRTSEYISGQNIKKYRIISITLVVIVSYVITGQPIFCLILLPIGFILANIIEENRKNKIKKLLEEQYIQILSSMSASLQAGANPYQALEETAVSLKDPAKSVFIEIIKITRTGISYHEAIAQVAEKTKWEDLKQIQMAFELYNKTGSNLVEVFSFLLKAAFQNRANKKYAESMSSQARLSLLIISIIPFFIIIYMRFMAPEFAYPLFNTAGGIIITSFVMFFVIIGNKLAKKVIDDITK